MHTSASSSSSVDDILAQEITNIKICDQVESADEDASAGPWWISPEEEEKVRKIYLFNSSYPNINLLNSGLSWSPKSITIPSVRDGQRIRVQDGWITWTMDHGKTNGLVCTRFGFTFGFLRLGSDSTFTISFYSVSF